MQPKSLKLETVPSKVTIDAVSDGTLVSPGVLGGALGVLEHPSSSSVTKASSSSNGSISVRVGLGASSSRVIGFEALPSRTVTTGEVVVGLVVVVRRCDLGGTSMVDSLVAERYSRLAAAAASAFRFVFWLRSRLLEN